MWFELVKAKIVLVCLEFAWWSFVVIIATAIFVWLANTDSKKDVK